MGTRNAPRYQQIAADIAAKIISGEYRIGEKIYARSTLASQYHVSSETARRAICVLCDMKIVEAEQGVGVVIRSTENAGLFLRQFEEQLTITAMKEKLDHALDEQNRRNNELKQQVEELMDTVTRFKSMNPFIPYQITVEAGMKHIGKNLAEINFWHNTLATVLAIRHQDQLLLSPGPYAKIHQGDILYYIGSEDCILRVDQFFKGKGE